MSEAPSEVWPVATPRAEVLTRVVQRGRRIRRVRHLLMALAVGGVVAVGAGGYALGASGRVDVVADGTVTVPDATASYHACPGTTPIGDLHRGDRVLLTGRSADGAWFELRSPIDLLDRAWVPATAVTPDADDDLPVVECGLTDEEVATVDGVVEPTEPDGTTTTTTTTDPGAATTTTTVPPVDATTPTTPPPGQPTVPGTPPTVPPGPTSTTAPGPVPPPTSPPPTAPPPTPPPDTTGPTISGFQRSVAAINETGSEFCLPPATSTVRASVTDPSGVGSVTLHWSFDGAGGPVTGSRPMTLQGGTYQATLGPFPATTITTLIGQVTVGWSVTAVDGAGNVRTVAAPPGAAVTLHNC